ncbi:putative MFS-type transporter YcaD (plasmid) [Roseovarius sp. THAF8]|uniref:MFS transporter n=1 Tax=Roseovarius sp. THAF8 TaxID=2587846 RepID=UPI001267CDE8|nr:MFS transporter [Roseovarius sp. THAF8]QFT99861.1 putative MFS-type transporter YcaD [Roseovarius sp. THAF8]
MTVILHVWALLFGVFLIMIGNGMQSTLMGVRGGLEGFSTFELSIVTSAYFAGFLIGSRIASSFIRSVGHVRVFAALGSFMSAGLIAFPIIVEPWAWALIRLLLGFCLSGVYVSAESWLNDKATNTTRGTILSAYMLAQTFGMVGAQVLVGVIPVETFTVFAVASILVSLSFAPILLSASPVPFAENIKPMSLKRLYRTSPLATVGTLLLGGVFAAQLGMASVYGSEIGLSTGRITLFVASIFVGSILFQVPVGWLSDIFDRRLLILGVAVVGGVASLIPWLFGPSFPVLLGTGVIMGGMASPLYSLLIAYCNDYLELEDMPAASGGMIFIYGLGAIAGPLITGQMMDLMGDDGFWLFIAGTFLAIAAWCAYRMTVRSAPPADEAGDYVSLSPNASQVAVTAVTEWTTEQDAEDENDQ